MRSFRRNQQGIVVGMVIMIASIFCVAFIYITTMPAVGLFWNAINPMLPSRFDPIMNMLNNVAGWTLLILVLGCVAYGAALAFKRDPIDVPG